jgi:mannose-6-phosphate isomerase-like protein (cupin superfamily)
MEQATSGARPEGLLIRRPGEGEAFWMPGHKITIKAEAADTRGHYGVILSEAPVGTAPPLHVHHGVDEGVWVARGRVRFRCGEREFTLERGSFTLLPHDVPHTFVVEGGEEALMLAMMSPGGSERYFAEAGTPATGAEPPSGPPDLERFARADAMFDAETVGPPLTPAG